MTDDKKFLQRIQKDPLWLNKQLWPDEPSWAKQEEIIRAVWAHKYVAVRSGNGVGKSHTAARLVLDYLIAWPGCKVITTAPTWEQVEKILWAEIHRHYGTSKYPIGGSLTQVELSFAPEWMAFGLSTNQAERFLGHHANKILVVMDEAAGVPDEIDRATRSLLTSEGAKILKVGNPIEPSGHFYDCFQSSVWKKLHISCYDSPNITGGKIVNSKLVTKQWIEERIAEYGVDSPWVQCFIHGEFPQQGADNLISLAWVLAAREKELTKTRQRAIGVDVARFGDDETVICLYDGGRVEILEVYTGQDTMMTAGHAKKAWDTYGCPVVVDDIGVGGGVTDRLREQGVNVIPFTASERAQRYGNYNNTSTAAWWFLREAFRKGEISIPKDDKLTSQLIGRKYMVASDGQISLERKEECKKRGLKSPDRADALAMAHWAARWQDREDIKPKPRPDDSRYYNWRDQEPDPEQDGL